MNKQEKIAEWLFTLTPKQKRELAYACKLFVKATSLSFDKATEILYECREKKSWPPAWLSW